MTRRARTALVVLLAGCGAATVTPVMPPPTAVEAPPVAHWTLAPDVTVPESAPFTNVEPDGDGWVAARGGIRLRVGDGIVREAPVAFLADILSVSHLGEAWVFVTRAGEVFRAREPLGAVEPVGVLGGRMAQGVVGRLQRLAVLDDRSMLWVGDADGIALAASDVPIVDAAFASPSLGARIGLGGTLERTRDGGRTWTAVALPQGVVPFEVNPLPDGMLVSVAQPRGLLVLHAEGAPESVAADPRIAAAPLPHEVSEALRMHFRFSGESRLSAHLTPSGHTLLRSTDRTFRRYPELGAAIALPEGCSASHTDTFGERFVVTCMQDERRYATDGVSPWVPIPWFEQVETYTALDAERVVQQGRCPQPASTGSKQDDEGVGGEIPPELMRQIQAQLDAQGSDDSEGDAEDPDLGDASDPAFIEEMQRYEQDRRYVCVRDASGDREVLVGDHAIPFGLVGARLYVRYTSDPTDDAPGQPTVVATMDLAAGDRLEPFDVPEGVDVERIEVTQDGTLLMPFTPPREGDDEYDPRNGEPTRSWLVGAIGALHVVTPPPGAGELHVADRAHAFALEDVGSGAWLSEDGGATFTHADVGDGSSFGMGQDACGPASCHVGGMVWGAQPLDDLLAPVASIDGAAVLVPPTREHAIAAHCERAYWWGGHPLSAPLPPLLHPPLVAPGGWLTLGAHGDAWTSGAITGRLGGIGADGAAFETALRRGSVPALPGATGEVTVRPVAVTPRLAVLERCAGEVADRACDLVGLPTDAAPFVTGTYVSFADAFSSPPSLGSALALPDGAIALQLTSAAHEPRAGTIPTDVIVVMQPNGSFTSRTLLSGWIAAHRTIARDAAGQPGLLVLRADTARFLAFDGSVGPVLTAPGARIGATCGERGQSDVDFAAGVLGADAGLVQPGTAYGDYGALPSEVVAAIGDGREACVREVLARTIPEDVRAVLVARAEHGVLVARYSAPGVRTTIETQCAPFVHDESADDETARTTYRWTPIDLRRASDGSARLLMAPGLAALSAQWIVGHVEGAGWSVASTPRLGEDILDATLVPASSEAAVFLRRGGGSATLVGGALSDLGADALGATGDGDARVVLLVERDDAGARFVARRGETVIARSESFGALVPGAVQWSDPPSGAAVRGIVGECDEDDRNCDARGFVIEGDRIRLLATVPAAARTEGEPPSFVLGRSARTSAVLLEVQDAEGGSHLDVLSLEGASARSIAPAIEATRVDGRVRPMALRLEPRPRVVYADTPAHASEPTHARVVELRGRSWVDVAEPWAIGSDGALALDAEGVTVIVSGGHAPRSARLEGTTWVPLTMTPPRREDR